MKKIRNTSFSPVQEAVRKWLFFQFRGFLTAPKLNPVNGLSGNLIEDCTQKTLKIKLQWIIDV